jgi:hypothetical protein
MKVSARELNRATLGRQLLLRREALDISDAVRRVVALQAQLPASPYLALWNRLTAFDPADLDAAFAGYTLVRATLMRLTLHVVHAGDYPAMHQAMQPTLRGPRLGDRRFTTSGLSAADADALVPDLLAFTARPRTAAEAEAWLGARLTVPGKGVWWALRSFAPLLQAPPPAGRGRSAHGRPTSPPGPSRCPANGTRPTRRCRRWSGGTWKGSAPRRWPTSRSSP